MDEGDAVEGEESAYSFEEEIEDFVSRMEGLRNVYPMLIGLVRMGRDASWRKYEEYIRTHGREVEGEAELFEAEQGFVTAWGEKSYRLPPHLVAGVNTRARQYVRLSQASSIVPTTFVVSLVSQYDAYLGRLIRGLFLAKPDVLNSVERTLTFPQLMGLGSIEQARDFLIEKEVESVMRESHAKQFDWLEKKLKVTLRKELDIWPRFIELTERRNLFVHTDGVVSSQYLHVCREHKVDVSDVEVGDSLSVSESYFTRAAECLLEMGVKLGHVMWRKLLPNEVEQADWALNEVCLDLIKQEEYSLAIALLKFATETLKRTPGQRISLVLRINLAQAHKWNDQEDVAARLLAEVDWSSLSQEFQLAHAVLRDDHESAYRLMRRIGSDDPYVNAAAYQEWPIFRQLRQTPGFVRTFEEVFGVLPQLEEQGAGAQAQARRKPETGEGEGSDTVADLPVDSDEACP